MRRVLALLMILLNLTALFVVFQPNNYVKAQTTATITVKPQASADDAYIYYDPNTGSGGISITAWLEAGDNTMAPQYDEVIGIRFPNVMIPRGAKIISAVLYIYETYGGHDIATFTIRGELSPDAAQFSTYDDFINRPKTTAYVTWTDADWIEEWEQINVTTIIQEIVNQATWQEGNALVIFIEDNNPSDKGASGEDDWRLYDSFDDSGLNIPSNIPYLVITYEVGEPDISLTADATAKSSPPYQSVSFTITLTNNGTATGTYSISASDSLGWSLSLNTTTATLDAGQSTKIGLTVNVPFAQAGTQDTITVTATETNTGLQRKITLTVTEDVYMSFELQSNTLNTLVDSFEGDLSGWRTVTKTGDGTTNAVLDTAYKIDGGYSVKFTAYLDSISVYGYDWNDFRQANYMNWSDADGVGFWVYFPRELTTKNVLLVVGFYYPGGETWKWFNPKVLGEGWHYIEVYWSDLSNPNFDKTQAELSIRLHSSDASLDGTTATIYIDNIRKIHIPISVSPGQTTQMGSLTLKVTSNVNFNVNVWGTDFLPNVTSLLVDDPDADGYDELSLDYFPIITPDNVELVYYDDFTTDTSANWVCGATYHTYTWDTANSQLVITANSDSYEYCYYSGATFSWDDGIIVEMKIKYGDSWGGITLTGNYVGYIDSNPARVGVRHIEGDYNQIYGSGGTIIYHYTDKPAKDVWTTVKVIYIKRQWWVFVNGKLVWSGKDLDDDFVPSYIGIVTPYTAGTSNYIDYIKISRIKDVSKVSYGGIPEANIYADKDGVSPYDLTLSATAQTLYANHAYGENLSLPVYLFVSLPSPLPAGTYSGTIYVDVVQAR